MARITRRKAVFASTKQVAEVAGIARSTLERWIRERRVKPKTMQVGRKAYRLWTDREIVQVLLVKKKTYCKGRGRKRKRE